MALTGLQIQKLLPKTNCKECGSNTCLAFAMKLAAKKADLSQCPYASDEAKSILGAASEPPVRSVEVGVDPALTLGGETVLYRHEKTFVHPTALAVNINDTDDPDVIDETLAQVRDYILERVGERLRIDMVAVTHRSGDSAAYVALCKKAWEETRRPIVMNGANPETLVSAAEALRGTRCVLASAPPDTVGMLLDAAKKYRHALAITAPDLNGLFALAAHIKEDGFNDLFLHFQTHSLAEQFQTNSIARRAALKDNLKSLGYPYLSFIENENIFAETVRAVNEISKYGGVCILPGFDPAQMASLMTLRLNIFTDPQKPIQVEPKVYEIGEPRKDSPVFVTTNFSLTYFIVSGEIENNNISAWLVVPECEGMSVLTAWAAGKFTGATVGKFVKEIGLEKSVTSREIIIPGYVAQISGELEEQLPGWKVTVGPQEAADLEGFINAKLRTA